MQLVSASAYIYLIQKAIILYFKQTNTCYILFQTIYCGLVSIRTELNSYKIKQLYLTVMPNVLYPKYMYKLVNSSNIKFCIELFSPEF